MSKRALMLVATGVHDEEAAETLAFLAEHDVAVDVAAPTAGPVETKHSRLEVVATLALTEVDADLYDLVLVPGGGAPEVLRLNDTALAITRSVFQRDDVLVAAICHGPQLFISAGVLAGRTLTCFAGIRDDVRLAGGRYVDKKVVADDVLITSRTPQDMEAFHAAILSGLFPEETGSPTDSVTEDGEPTPTDEVSPEPAAG